MAPTIVTHSGSVVLCTRCTIESHYSKSIYLYALNKSQPPHPLYQPFNCTFSGGTSFYVQIAIWLCTFSRNYQKYPSFFFSTSLFALKFGAIHPALRTGWPRHRKNRENREFGCSFFQTGKTQGICQKILKIQFYTGNLPPTQGKFWSFKN